MIDPMILNQAEMILQQQNQLRLQLELQEKDDELKGDPQQFYQQLEQNFEQLKKHESILSTIRSKLEESQAEVMQNQPIYIVTLPNKPPLELGDLRLRPHQQVAQHHVQGQEREDRLQAPRRPHRLHLAPADL